MTAIPVAYGPAELLKVTVMFNFDRYIMIPRRATGVKKGTQKDNSSKQGQDTDFNINIMTADTDFFDGEPLPFNPF
jgi:hypothetical protein